MDIDNNYKLNEQELTSTLDHAKKGILEISDQFFINNLYSKIVELNEKELKELMDYTNKLGYNKHIIGVMSTIVNYISENNINSDINNVLSKDENELKFYLENMSVELAKNIWERYYRATRNIFDTSDVTIIEFPSALECYYKLVDILESSSNLEFKKIICKKYPELIIHMLDKNEIIEVITHMKCNNDLLLDSILKLNSRLLIRAQEILIENNININPIKEHISLSDTIQIYSLKNNFTTIIREKHISEKVALEFVKYDFNNFKNLYPNNNIDESVFINIVKEYPQVIKTREFVSLDIAEVAINKDKSLMSYIFRTSKFKCNIEYRVKLLRRITKNCNEEIIKELAKIDIINEHEVFFNMMIDIISKNLEMLKYFVKDDYGMIKCRVLSLNHEALKFIDNPDIQMCIGAVLKDDALIEYVPEEFKEEVIKTIKELRSGI